MAHKLDTLPSSSVEHDQQLVYGKQTFAQDKPFGLFWGNPSFLGGCQKFSRTVVLLMVQKSDNHHLACIKNHVTKGTNYQPQLVCRISSINSINLTPFQKNPKQCTIGEISQKITISLHCFISSKWIPFNDPIGASQHEA